MIAYGLPRPGEVAEWSNAPVLKTGVSERGPRVRIPPSPQSMLKVRNKRVIVELLQDPEAVAFEKIQIAEGLDQDEQTKEILRLALERGVEVEEKPRKKMARRRSGETHEAILGALGSPDKLSLKNHLASLEAKGEAPFFLLLNKVGFASNLGIAIRTAFAAGVNGIIYQESLDRLYNDDTLHYSLGAIARIPLIKMTIFDAFKQLTENNITTYVLDMEGQTYSETDLTGPAAFVLGAERDGVSDKVLERCDKKLSIPMKGGLDSLNVSASASIILYEKLRQDNRLSHTS